MKSKISFFNKTIFLKNLTLFWPIWCGYLVFLLIAQPGMLWLMLMQDSQSQSVFQEISYSNKLVDLETIMSMPFLLIQTAVMAVLTGMALFHYLCTAKSTNMIHALPVTRGELFGTNTISGLAFMIIPQVISFFVIMPVCLGNGIYQVEYLGIFVLLEIGMSVLWYSIAVFCAMMTGQMFAIPLFFLVVNLLYVVLRLLVQAVTSFYAYGVVEEFSSVLRSYPMDILSPLFFLYAKLGITDMQDVNDGFITRLQFHGCGYVGIYLLAAVAIYAAAYVFYRQRQLEHAGDLVSFGFARPLFRWGVSFFFAYFMGMVGIMLEGLALGKIRIFPAIVFGLLCGMIAFCISQMILGKNFRIFRKRFFKECGCMVAFLVITLLVMWWHAYRAQEYIPAEQQIESAWLNLDYELAVDEKDYKELRGLHKLALDCGADNYKWNNDAYYDMQGYLRISYQLKNGKTVTRAYYIPEDFEGQDFIDYFKEQSRYADNFLNNILQKNYATVAKNWDYAYVCYPNEENSDFWIYDNTGNETEGQEKLQDTTAVDAVYQAVIADAYTGTLQNYNLDWSHEESDENTVYQQDGAIDLAWREPLQEGSNSSNLYDSDYWEEHYATIYFGPGCENITKVIEECRNSNDGTAHDSVDLDGTESEN